MDSVSAFTAHLRERYAWAATEMAASGTRNEIFLRLNIQLALQVSYERDLHFVATYSPYRLERFTEPCEAAIARTLALYDQWRRLPKRKPLAYKTRTEMMRTLEDDRAAQDAGREHVMNTFPMKLLVTPAQYVAEQEHTRLVTAYTQLVSMMYCVRAAAPLTASQSDAVDKADRRVFRAWCEVRHTCTNEVDVALYEKMLNAFIVEIKSTLAALAC